MQITELAAKLQSLGLTDKEAKVYVASLFLGPAPVQKIAEQAGVNRATAYVILDQLAELGLVSQSTEGKKTVYIAEGPEALDRVFDKQRNAVELRRQELKDLLPQIKEIQRQELHDAPVVRFYKGTEGIKAMSSALRRKARLRSVIYGMTNVDEVRRIEPTVASENPQRRMKKQLSSKLLYSGKEDVPSNPKLLRETKKLSESVKADINLYEDGAMLLSYHGDDPVGIIIESPEIVGALRQLFDLAWDNQKK